MVGGVLAVDGVVNKGIRNQGAETVGETDRDEKHTECLVRQRHPHPATETRGIDPEIDSGIEYGAVHHTNQFRVGARRCLKMHPSDGSGVNGQ